MSIDSVDVYRRWLRRRDRWRNLTDAVFNGFWLGVMSPATLRTVDTTFYAIAREEVDGAWHRYTDPEHIRSGLFDWERSALGDVPRGAPVVVTSAGAGREVLGLLELGYDAVGYEPNPDLVAAGRAVLPEPDRLRPGTWDQFPDHDGHAAAVVIGWGSYMLITRRDSRRALLRDAYSALSPGGVLLVSYFPRPETRYFTVVRGAANALRRLRRLDLVELGDTLTPNFVHYFAHDEIVDDLRAAGFEVTRSSSEPYGHTVASRPR